MWAGLPAPLPVLGWDFQSGAAAAGVLRLQGHLLGGHPRAQPLPCGYSGAELPHLKLRQPL